MAPAEGSNTGRDAIQRARRTGERELRAMYGVATAVLFFADLGVARVFFGNPIVIAVLTICGQYASSRSIAELSGAW